MQRRTPPIAWLFTDDRLDERSTRAAIRRLPPGSGVVFRHYAHADRAALGRRLARLARRLGHVVLVAEDPSRPLKTGIQRDGTHLPSYAPRRPPHARGLVTAAAHNLRELREARRKGAALVFVSPVFATRSHPGAPAFGRLGFALLARRSSAPVIALGGMTPARFRSLRRLGASGWAAIDYWSRPRS